MSLLPESIADTRCRALDTLSQRLETLEIAVVLTLLLDRVATSALPHLAWQFHVENYDSSAPAADQRALIREAMLLHRRRGTPWAIRRALEMAGYQQVQVMESTRTAVYYDGTIDYDGQFFYDAGVSAWATYSVAFGAQAVLQAPEFARIRRMLALIQPVRCQLVNLIQYDFLYDGAQTYAGAETYDGVL